MSVAALEVFLRANAPPGPRKPLEPILHADEADWFFRGIRRSLFSFSACPLACPRYKRWSSTGRDEFLTPSGARRHLYSAPGQPQMRLNREYLPHLAAYSYAVEAGFLREQSLLSVYRRFQIASLPGKKPGQRYETDAEFYGPTGALELQIEAKSRPNQVEKLATQIDQAHRLRRMPMEVAKEIVYVLELKPKCLWIVGPGSIDPPLHVFHVQVTDTDASFERLQSLRSP